ncbi:MAG: lysophospholipase L1-like esterase [Myxococcota bacterium]|jgi:lysophospholipase L1-like esterase
MHLGTNDVFESNDHASTIAEPREVVVALRADNPTVVILWALLIPTNNPALSPGIDELNALVQPVAIELNTTQSPLRIVDLNQGFDAAVMTYDDVHPNADGEAWMADRWLAAI